MGVSRRDFVAMLLGAPIAAQLACRSRGHALPPGRLIETGMTRGHALIRDGALPKATRTRELGVAIIGGGVAGLACAWELRRRGVRDATVLELDDVFGGTARGGVSEITPYPWGAHYIVAPQSNADALVPLLAEMGAIEGYGADGSPIIDEALRCREPEERVWYAGRWWEGLYLDAGANADDRRQLRRAQAGRSTAGLAFGATTTAAAHSRSRARPRPTIRASRRSIRSRSPNGSTGTACTRRGCAGCATTVAATTTH